MIPRCVCVGVALSLAALSGIVGQPASSHAQSSGAGAPESGALVSPMDPGDAEIIRRLSPEQLERLNARLREAMLLYYDQSYRLAVPILQEIAQEAPTLDVLYWLGTAALRSNQPDIAEARFRQMLARRPDLHPVRVQLAGALLQQGRKDEAQAELQIVAESETAEAGVRQQVANLQRNIARLDRRYHFIFRATAGLSFDTNAGAAPGEGTIAVPIRDGTGAVQTVTVRTEEKSGWARTLATSAELAFMPVRELPVQLVTSGSLFFNDYAGNDEFNYSMMELRTGPRFLFDRTQLTVPVGAGRKRYDDYAYLSSYRFVAPEIIYQATDDLAILGVYRLEREDYNNENRGQSHTSHSGTVGARLGFDLLSEKDFGLVRLSYLRHNAETNPNTYTEIGVAPTLGTALPWQDLDLVVSGGLFRRSYDAPALGYARSRRDVRMQASAVLSKSFNDRYILSAYGTRIRNQANESLYDYDKWVVGVNATFLFDY